ncbi:MAG: GldG family protein [Deltaproteobacteria bacterium]|nr:GldG family protein [Deltaproteobacteria bacterium]
MAKQIQNKASMWIIVLSTLGSLIMLNVLFLDFFARVDLTQEKVFTLSAATLQTLEDIEDPVTITAYFTKDLPPQFASNARYVADLLEEYRERSGGNLSFEFIDPAGLETDEDKETKKNVKRDFLGRPMREPTELEKKLAKLEIQAVQMQVINNDEQVKKSGYMGISIRYQEETKSIPVVHNVDSLEYELTTQIRLLTRPRTPVLGIAQGHEEPSLTENQFFKEFSKAVSENYDVRPVELGKGSASDLDGALAAVDALLVIGPKKAFTEEQAKAVDRFLLQGKSAAFLVDSIQMDIGTFQPTPSDHGLDKLLEGYGFTLSGDLIADLKSASLMAPEKRGRMTINRPITYFFLPTPDGLDPKHPLTKGLGQLMLPFSSAVYLTAKEGLEGKVLVKSSEKSWLQAPNKEALSPRKEWRQDEVKMNGPHEMMAATWGKLPSAFGQTVGSKMADDDVNSESKVIVLGTAAMFKDEFMQGGSAQLTAAMLINMIDWMLMEPGFVEMRTRGQREAPLVKLEESTRQVIKALNLLGGPALVLLLGAFIWQRRSARRKRYQKVFKS